MNLKELAGKISASTGGTEAEAKAAVVAVFDQIAAAVSGGEEVSVPGFGKFTVKDRPERQGRNPATGEAMTIPASRKLSFAAAKALRDSL